MMMILKRKLSMTSVTMRRKVMMKKRSELLRAPRLISNTYPKESAMPFMGRENALRGIRLHL
jgi:hypothetical protein